MARILVGQGEAQGQHSRQEVDQEHQDRVVDVP
jgi:hypothetical protein